MDGLASNHAKTPNRLLLSVADVQRHTVHPKTLYPSSLCGAWTATEPYVSLVSKSTE